MNQMDLKFNITLSARSFFGFARKLLRHHLRQFGYLQSIRGHYNRLDLLGRHLVESSS